MRPLDTAYMWDLVPVIAGYVPLTLFMAIVAMAAALTLGSALAIVRVLRVPVLDRIVAVFISFFRGTPLLVQLFLFYFGLPQAARTAAPTLMNYFIDMIKSTSLAFTLGVTEMMGAAQKEAAGSFLYLEAFLVVALFYWVIVETLSVGQRRLESSLGKAVAR